MYNLQRVYATLSFERNKINLLVVDKTTDNKINCLYFNSCQCEYLDENLCFVNHADVVNKLLNLISGADKFLGINIKRYIVNISCLPIRSEKGQSSEFIVFQNLNLDHANNYVSKALSVLNNASTYALKIYPVGWYLDGQYSTTFPEGSIGKKISFDYVAIVAKRSVVDQFLDIVHEVSGKVLSVVCNSLCLGVLANGNGIDGLVIDIKTTSTIINVYNKHGEIKTIITIPKGSNWFINEVKKILDVPKSQNILPSIEALDILANVKEDVVLLQAHKEQFLSIQQANTKTFSSALKLVVKYLFKDIEAAIISMNTQFNFNKAYLSIVDTLVPIFKEASPIKILDNVPIQLLNNSVIGLEDYAINHMLAAILYVHHNQTVNDEVHTYSIDPFISNKAVNAQSQQGLLVRLGILSTKWAAKI